MQLSFAALALVRRARIITKTRYHPFPTHQSNFKRSTSNDSRCLLAARRGMDRLPEFKLQAPPSLTNLRAYMLKVFPRICVM